MNASAPNSAARPSGRPGRWGPTSLLVMKPRPEYAKRRPRLAAAWSPGSARGWPAPAGRRRSTRARSARSASTPAAPSESRLAVGSVSGSASRVDSPQGLVGASRGRDPQIPPPVGVRPNVTSFELSADLDRLELGQRLGLQIASGSTAKPACSATGRPSVSRYLTKPLTSSAFVGVVVGRLDQQVGRRGDRVGRPHRPRSAGRR